MPRMHDSLLLPHTALLALQPPAPISNGPSRFAYAECNETRSWKDIAEAYKPAPYLFESGSLGTFETDSFHVWACFWDHACLLKVAAAPGTDAMCYEYHETDKTWHAWALKSEIPVCSAASQP